MNLQLHKEIAEYFLLDMNRGSKADFSRWDDIIHPDYHSGENPDLITQNMVPGRDAFRKRIENLNQKVDDLKYEIISTVAEGDQVIVHHKTYATNSHGIWGLPPSHIRTMMQGFHRFTFKDGKIYQIYLVLDTLTALVEWGDAVIKGSSKLEVERYIESLKKVGLIPERSVVRVE